MWAKLLILYSYKSLVWAVMLVCGTFVVVGCCENLEKWVKHGLDVGVPSLGG